MFDVRRITLLVLALTSLALGISLLFSQSNSGTNFSGIFVRLGVMLSVLWIAFPQIESLRSRTSLFVIGTIVVLFLVVAARPRIFPIAAGVALATIILNGIMRRLSGAHKRDFKNRKT